jgi:hypothetical protein
MKRVISFVLITIMSYCAFSQNRVENPGFEKWDKLNKPAGWSVAQNCLRDSVYIRSGDYSCRHEGGTKYLGQIIRVNQDKKYRLSFFYKTSITGTGNGCRIWCYWKDADGNNLTDANTDDILRPSKYLKSDVWQQFSAEFSTPERAASFYLEVRTYSNSISYFDDFVFEENVTTSAPEDEFSKIMIYPNPASEYLTINNISDFLHIDFLNLSGIIICSFECSGEESAKIDVSGMSVGMYIVRLQSKVKIITQRFIKKGN